MLTKQNKENSSLKFGYVFELKPFLCFHMRCSERKKNFRCSEKTCLFLVVRSDFLKLCEDTMHNASNTVSLTEFL